MLGLVLLRAATSASSACAAAGGRGWQQLLVAAAGCLLLRVAGADWLSLAGWLMLAADGCWTRLLNLLLIQSRLLHAGGASLRCGVGFARR